MSLETKKLEADLENDYIARKQTFIKDETGMPITFKINWASFGEAKPDMFPLIEGAVNEITNKIVSMSTDATSKAAIGEAISSIEISHDAAISVPEDFKISVANKILSFSANFEIYTIDDTSSHKSFRQTLEETL